MAKKPFTATVFFFHRSGVVSIATVGFSGSAKKWDVARKVGEILLAGGSPTHLANFRTTYTNVDDVVDVLVTTKEFHLHLSHEEKV